jgi:inorganic pyrophosphatase
MKAITIKVNACGAIRMIDRGLYDDKLICSHSPIPPWKQGLILLFFMIYARAKSLLNLTSGRKGRNSCQGWQEAEAALARATPRANVDWKGPAPFLKDVL